MRIWSNRVELCLLRASKTLRTKMKTETNLQKDWNLLLLTERSTELWNYNRSETSIRTGKLENLEI